MQVHKKQSNNFKESTLVASEESSKIRTHYWSEPIKVVNKRKKARGN